MKELNTYHDHQEDPKLPDSLRVNPFSVPENYFREAQSMLISTLRLDKSNASNPFSVPDNYFETIKQQVKAQTVLPLPTENNGMEVPERYFEELSTHIASQLADAKLKESVQEAGFAVPQDYFEQAKEQLINQVNMESHGTNLNENAFEIRSGYFDGLSSRILEKIKTKENTAVLPETSDNVRSIGRSTPRWTRILAAASVIVTLSLGIYWGLNNTKVTTPHPVFAGKAVSLEDITDDELVNYLAMNNDGLDYLVEYILLDNAERGEPSVTDFADQDLEEYIKFMLE